MEMGKNVKKEDGLESILRSVVAAFDDWVEILDFHAAKEGRSVEYCQDHGQKLAELLKRRLGLEDRRAIAAINAELMARFSRTSPESIRNEYVRYLEDADLDSMAYQQRDITVFMTEIGLVAESDDSIALEVPRSESEQDFKMWLAYFKELTLTTSPLDVSDYISVYNQLKNLPIEFWVLTKKLILVAWRGVSAMDTDELIADIGECLATGVWTTQLHAGIDPMDEVRSGIVPEYEAVVLDREHIYGLTNAPDKAFELLSNGLGHFLERILKRQGWAVPGARFTDSGEAPDREQGDTWNMPHNEETQLMQIGLLKGLNWAAMQELSGLKKKAKTGELRRALTKASRNELLREIRCQNRRLGSVLMKEPYPEGKTEDKIREQIAQANASRASKEIPDYDVEGEEETNTSMLGMASDSQSFEKWKVEQSEDESQEDERQELITQRIMELAGKARLTPRQKLMARLYNLPDEDIANALQKEFGKPVKPGAVRKLRHDLVKKLREADPAK